ncbi:MAG: transposase [Saprospiraceae bacterium]|nr:transposase [Saprospiraceae bacterium]
MKLKSGEIYHVYSRGNNRQRVFYDRENYLLFLSKIRVYLSPQCDMLAYCLMPNHFHFLVHANKKSARVFRRTHILTNSSITPKPKMSMFSKGLQLLLSSYAKSINRRYTRSGSLFRQNTKWKKTSDEMFSLDYSLSCFSYIHYNPVTAGLVNSPEDWEFSSYREYAGLTRDEPICNLELGKSLLCLQPNDMFNLSSREIPNEILKKIFK